MGVLKAYRQYRNRRIRLLLGGVLGISLLPALYFGISSAIPEPSFDLIKLIDMPREAYEDDGMTSVYHRDTMSIQVVYKGTHQLALPSYIQGIASDSTILSVRNEAEPYSLYNRSVRNGLTYVYLETGMLVFDKNEFRYFRYVNNLKPYP